VSSFKDHFADIALNQALWNSWTPHHVDSTFYDTASVIDGRDTIDNVMSGMVGDVSGKRLLHVMCHFGHDTISLTRRGAQATGVDFSEVAIAAARELATKCAVDTEFVCADVYAMPEQFTGAFDCVMTSHGVLGWLPDITGWANAVARCLAPGGQFHIAEVHPVIQVFDESAPEGVLRKGYPYWHASAPIEAVEEGTYAVPAAPTSGQARYWNHALSEIVTALLGAGLRVTALEEHSKLPWPVFPWMVRGDDGWWRLPHGAPDLPVMFSLSASR
jgi:2-polyprenyl-3-methyl-5-hydroxy-6-metoxy-1,4-benzoquinol methylase